MKAQYIEAPNIEKPKYPSVFLAGGITNCPEWQDDLKELLSNEMITIFNPRRKKFPIHDPNAAKEQITWEFKALNGATIFSMWFCNTDSDQPICLYELGRHLVLRKDCPETIVIGVEPGYRRAQDVYIQTGLVNPLISLKISDNLNDHAFKIKKAIEIYIDKGLWK